MRKLRAALASKKASTDAGCTVQYTIAVVVPQRSNSSRKNWRLPARAGDFQIVFPLETYIAPATAAALVPVTQ
jgi:hypothetical protein